VDFHAGAIAHELGDNIAGDVLGCTLLNRCMAIEIGIITIHKTVSHPLAAVAP
jgi:hypothetical protein